jgi:hypothetical protein
VLDMGRSIGDLFRLSSPALMGARRIYGWRTQLYQMYAPGSFVI